jgi:glutaredoxin
MRFFVSIDTFAPLSKTDSIRMRLVALLLCLCLSFLVVAQKDVQLFEKQENGQIVIYAKNVSKQDLKIDLRIESSGLNLSNSMPHTQILKAGTTEEAITLTPIPNMAWSYKTSLSYTPVDNKTDYSISTESPKHKGKKPLTESNGIVLYTKPGCGRCKQAVNHLQKSGTQYREVDISERSSDVDAMWLALREQGFEGSSIKTPVIQINRKLYYQMQDVDAFLEKMGH